MLKVLKFFVILVIAAIVGIFLAKIIWMNLTPGYYHGNGCCSYGYMTKEEILEYDAQDKSKMCALSGRCNRDPGYEIDMFFRNFDFNK